MQKFAKKYKLPIIAGFVFVVLTLVIGAKRTGLLGDFRKTTAPLQEIVSNTTKSESINLVVETGKVQLLRNGAETFIPNGSKEILQNGDTVNTGDDTIALIRYPTETVVRLAPNSSLKIDTNQTSLNFTQSTGTIFVRFKKVIGIQDEANVETPDAVATIRGTKLVSKIDPKSKESKFIMVEHEVDLYKKDPTTGKKLDNTKKLLQEGMQAQVGRQGIIRIAKQVLTEDEKRWLELNKDTLDQETKLDIFQEILRRYFQSPSPSPVSSTKPSPSISSSPSAKPISYIQAMFGTGYNSGRVKTESGEFPISCYGAPQGTKVITDSANESDCKNDCPVLPLHEYATRNNGIAAINGMYFCPADYPACADKKNSFDTLFFNSRVKKYINSDNNVYSSIPFLVINADGSPRFIGRSLEWGRDTNIQAGTAGNPILVQGGNISAVEGNLDEKQRTVKANRGAFVQKSPNIYLCIVGSATVMDSARVYKTLGVDNAINIDGGGSSALWVNGSYKYGPGRNIPTAIIFAR